VQGAWGIIPAHLAELSPDSVRALLPGFAYQTAGLITSFIGPIEALYAQHTSYSAALAVTALVVFAVASFMAWMGRERHRQRFGTA
jgi:SHS family lactate transporter-like MFS transporter